MEQPKAMQTTLHIAILGAITFKANLKANKKYLTLVFSLVKLWLFSRGSKDKMGKVVTGALRHTCMRPKKRTSEAFRILTLLRHLFFYILNEPAYKISAPYVPYKCSKSLCRLVIGDGGWISVVTVFNVKHCTFSIHTRAWKICCCLEFTEENFIS